MIWMGVGFVALLVTYYGFSFNVVRDSFFKRKAIVPKKVIAKKVIKPESVIIPVVRQVVNTGTHFIQLGKLSVFYAKMVLKEIPFIAIVILRYVDTFYQRDKTWVSYTARTRIRQRIQFWD